MSRAPIPDGCSIPSVIKKKSAAAGMSWRSAAFGPRPSRRTSPVAQDIRNRMTMIGNIGLLRMPGELKRKELASPFHRESSSPSKRMEAGQGFVIWDGTDAHGSEVASGVYFYETNALGQVTVNKMALLK